MQKVCLRYRPGVEDGTAASNDNPAGIPAFRGQTASRSRSLVTSDDSALSRCAPLMRGMGTLSEPRRARRFNHVFGSYSKDARTGCGRGRPRPAPTWEQSASVSGGRRARPGGRHCEQRLGKGPVRPPGPAAPKDAHQEASNAAGLARDSRWSGPNPPSAGSGLKCPGRPVEARSKVAYSRFLRLRSSEEVVRFRPSRVVR
jgi:hypothetical protein